ncbi:MAG: hypothetical protein Q8L74_09665 [Nitrospirota bacterium]|nr:hypothetical protein [Nitrospirota bacterium]MDP2382525.1 hypothetical protein [Nitrospirota bacterium]MDP3596903.1 hypothetical protein [Nitrospirota bacterium]
MKRMLVAIMAVAIAMIFNSPSFAGEEQKVKKSERPKSPIFFGATSHGRGLPPEEGAPFRMLTARHRTEQTPPVIWGTLRI